MGILSNYYKERTLLSKARVAAAWGVPDNESYGYSQSELCSIIRELVHRVEYLEKLVPEDKKYRSEKIHDI